MVYLVGAGPGDEDLMTQKGRRLLAQAEVLVYDRLASAEFLRQVPGGCETIYVGKESGRHSMKQEEINQVLVRKALEGKLVIRLKGGDPFVFGRGGEEILELEKHRIPYEVVPGVTSAIAALAHAGIPVTHRGIAQSFHVITGHTAEGGGTMTGDFSLYGKLSGTLVFLMGLSNLERIVKMLIQNGKDPATPAAVVTDGTLPSARCIRAPLSTLPKKVREAGLKSPGIIVVGETAAFHMTCEQERLLTGITIGVTGTDGIFEKLSAKLSSLGAKIVRAAVSRVDAEGEKELDREVMALSSRDWVVFTSRNAVSLFFQAMKRNHVDLRALGAVRFAVVGRGTGDFLKGFGFFPDYMPERYTTEALARGLTAAAKPGEHILIPRAKQGSRILTETLDASGFTYTDLPIYDIHTEQVPLEALNGLDYITFESGSGVRGFFEGRTEEVQKLFQTARPVCIGQVTADVLKEYGVEHALVAEDYTAGGITGVLVRERENGRFCL